MHSEHSLNKQIKPLTLSDIKPPIEGQEVRSISPVNFLQFSDPKNESKKMETKKSMKYLMKEES